MPIHGKMHGRLIELVEDPGLAEGLQVEVELKPISTVPTWGKGVKRCAGLLANEWTEEDDRVLAEI